MIEHPPEDALQEEVGCLLWCSSSTHCIDELLEQGGELGLLRAGGRTARRGAGSLGLGERGIDLCVCVCVCVCV